ncbi:MAG: isoleucine--tRNA ligase [Myxococcaceae bacterium]
MGETEKPQGKEYKDTLNLPRTEFPMKGNLGTLEPRMLAWWEEKGTYQKILEKNASNEPFVLHDGPPYANGHLHAGHALNKVLKDIIVKYRNISGRYADYIPGWDTHGLPIEQAVEKRLKEKKIDKRSLSRDELLDACRAYALEFIDIQREEFKRLGVFGRWTEPYLTLNFAYEAQEIRELATIARRGLMYRRKKPVYWCITDQTALAEAEVEYDDHTSPSVYVAMRARGDLSKLSESLRNRPVSFVIWTTTPWTLPANLAIAVHPEFEYVFYDLQKTASGREPGIVCVAKDLLATFLAEVAPEELAVKEVPAAGAVFEAAAFAHPERILAFARGEDLEGVEYHHPFIDRVSKVILGEHVTLEAGTGLVHTAPGHGQEDYEVGLKYGLDVYNPVKNDGRYDDTVGAGLAGLKVWDANAKIVGMMEESGVLLNKRGDTVRHSYPHCWRCHNPIIFAGTWQWFIALDKEMSEGGGTLRQKALHEIDHSVKWIPDWGRDRIFNMLEGRPDWTISRQRTWGVPIPVAFCTACDEAVVSPELMENVANAVEKEGVGVWYREDVRKFLPEGFACPKCGGAEFHKETDILDVWFDSAVSFVDVAEKRLGLKRPVDLYLEGSDQHRGWFHSALLVSTATRDRAPYKSVLTHGFVVDGEGRKMSKSIGNTVAPEKMILQYGAEVVRLWVASSDYRDDVRLSDQILKGLSEGYRKIRNTLRYALSNLYDFDPAKDAVREADLLPLDKWAKARTGELVERVRKAYEAYEFHLVYHSVVEFCGVDLSAIYFDILKDRLYTAKADSKARRSAQTVLYAIAKDLLRVLAPVTSFTAEEAWQFLPGEKTESVFLAGFPEGAPAADGELMRTFEKLLAVRSAAQGLLEIARRDKLIGSSLEARLVIHATGEVRDFLHQHLHDLPAYFIVSQVELTDATPEAAQPLSLGNAFPASAKALAKVERAKGQKCPRCWTYSERIGADSELCEKCEEALR